MKILECLEPSYKECFINLATFSSVFDLDLLVYFFEIEVYVSGFRCRFINTGSLVRV